MLNTALQGIASLFQVTPGPVRRERWELPLLVLLTAVAAVLRFWGLGSVGLHGDEETMAMPVMHIVEHGTPEFPSGMFYARAIGQLYIMAGSVLIFGESEWAFRLPSVLCGVLLVPLAWWAGKRFLAPVWSAALAACVAFLPEFILVAQTARMYVFLVASLAAYAGFVFSWERTGRVGYLAAAMGAFVVAMHFQILALFAVLLFLFPGLLRNDRRMLAWGVAAVVLGVIAYVAISGWYQSFYPHSIASALQEDAPALLEERGGLLFTLSEGGALVIAGVALAAALALFAVRPVGPIMARYAAGALVFAGLACQILMSYHLAALLLLGGGVVAVRFERSVLRRLPIVLAGSVALAVAHVIVLKADGMGSLWKIAGELSGLPSVWAYLAIGRYSAAALIFAGAGIAWASWRVANGGRASDVWLFFVLTVWVPLLMLGMFDWAIPKRYTDFAVLPLLVCGLAAAQNLCEARRMPAAAAAGMAALLVVNPVAFAREWNAGYAAHPDHKGAAEFVRSVAPGPNDILVAEDVLQQTYYLGRVDYWLLGEHVGLRYSQRIGGEPRDIYTHARLIGTGAELMALVARRDRGAIYVIGSGEEQRDGRRYARGHGIFEALQSPQFREVYRGRDGLTRVWKVEAPR
jgi:uncharacterized membrane protein